MENKVILLVEDSHDDALLTKRALRKNGLTNRVVVARDGAEALEYLLGPGEHASGVPLLVLLDLRLPKLDGPEVLRRIRACEQTRSLPVAILISYEGGMITGSEAQLADLCIQKVVDFEQFTKEVERLKPLLTRTDERHGSAGGGKDYHEFHHHLHKGDSGTAVFSDPKYPHDSVSVEKACALPSRLVGSERPILSGGAAQSTGRRTIL
jgi:two-component system, response regulator